MKNLLGKQQILKIYIDEHLRIEGEYTWRRLLEAARSMRLSGCTVLRGFAGFGPHHGSHNQWQFDGAGEWTMILEIVDSKEKLREFLDRNESILKNIVTFLKDITVRHYSSETIDQQSNMMEAQMSNSQLNGTKTLLRIFLGESDIVGHQNAYAEILEQARKKGLAGATVSRGIAGFGASSIMHEPHLFKLSSDLPIIVEIVDSQERIDQFLSQIEPLLKGALVTQENVDVRHHSSK